MSSVIRQETAVFLFSVLHGALLTIAYDVLRALRRSVRHSLAVLSLEDFFYWLLAGALTFHLAFLETDGELRGYAAVGMLLGFLLYHFTLSSGFVTVLSRLLRRITALLQKICKICKKRIEIARKKAYNVRYRI